MSACTRPAAGLLDGSNNVFVSGEKSGVVRAPDVSHLPVSGVTPVARVTANQNSAPCLSTSSHYTVDLKIAAIDHDRFINYCGTTG